MRRLAGLMAVAMSLILATPADAQTDRRTTDDGLRIFIEKLAKGVYDTDDVTRRIGKILEKQHEKIVEALDLAGPIEKIFYVATDEE